jgi:hypothetical protein
MSSISSTMKRSKELCTTRALDHANSGCRFWSGRPLIQKIFPPVTLFLRRAADTRAYGGIWAVTSTDGALSIPLISMVVTT